MSAQTFRATWRINPSSKTSAARICKKPAQIPILQNRQSSIAGG